MKKFCFLISMIAAVTIVSCKNNSKNADAAQDEVQIQKLEVADSVLAMIDKFEKEFVCMSDSAFRIPKLLVLTEDEKLVKPDYLLDPSEVGRFVTRYQKINALAYYTLEYGVREAYDMPLDDAKEAISKLSVDLDLEMDLDYLKSDVSESEKISRIFQACKEKGDITSFWQFQCAFIFHTDYIIACNPKLFIPKISEEALMQFNLRLEYVNNAATALAPYDQDMASLLKEIKAWDLLVDESEWDAAFANESTTAQFYLNSKDDIIERRNRMID